MDHRLEYQQLDLNSKAGLKHTRLCGDPHIYTDGAPPMDFPSPTCSFVLTDGTFIVADAPAANQPLNDVHIFTDDGQHFSLGQAVAFDDVVGTVFVQQDDGSFFGVVSRDVGTSNEDVPGGVELRWRSGIGDYAAATIAASSV